MLVNSIVEDLSENDNYMLTHMKSIFFIGSLQMYGAKLCFFHNCCISIYLTFDVYTMMQELPDLLVGLVGQLLQLFHLIQLDIKC